MLALITLLLLPGFATWRFVRSFSTWFFAGYLMAISGITLWLYWRDKRRAQAEGWRTPESTLHFAELCGGWPTAFLAQRIFRHKIAKTSYQVVFWFIVILHQAVCFDFLYDWHYLRSALQLLR